MTGYQVKLLHHEMEMAATVGLRRQLASIRADRKDRHGLKPEDGWRAHIEGACGECAVGKFLGRYWDGSVDTFKAFPDLGPLEVRTRSRHDYELLVRKDDNLEAMHVHITGLAPNFIIHGFLRGAEARRDEWLKTHGGREAAWFVPWQELRVDWPKRPDGKHFDELFRVFNG